MDDRLAYQIACNLFRQGLECDSAAFLIRQRLPEFLLRVRDEVKHKMTVEDTTRFGAGHYDPEKEWGGLGKIYIICERLGTGSGNVRDSTPGGDVVGYAFAEDGTVLASHMSSSRSFCQHDMGLTSNWKHNAYYEKYQHGFWLIDLTDRLTHEELLKVPEFAELWNKNQALFPEVDTSNSTVELAPAKPLPYPWCFQPEVCAGLGSCPRDPNCGD